MPIGIIRGPAGAGKSQWFEANREPGDLIIDVSGHMGRASRPGTRRTITGRYPVRLATDPGLRMALYLKSTAIRFAAENGISGWATTSNSSPVAVERLRGADRLWRRRWRSRARGHCGPWRVCGAFQAGGP